MSDPTEPSQPGAEQRGAPSPPLPPARSREEMERLEVLDLALDLAARVEAARLRLPAWVALGAGMVLLYVVLAPSRGPAFAAADRVVLMFIVASTALLVVHEWSIARRCRSLLRTLSMPRRPPAAGR